MGENTLTQDLLKELLHYDPCTGIFKWGVSGSGKVIGKVAGCTKKGMYVQLMINRKNYSAHRLAWLYMTGEWPDVIDHINREKSDNRWSNLRNGTALNNLCNTKRNTVFPGVYMRKDSGRYRAVITINSKKVNLGCFKTHIAACYARWFAEINLTSA